MAGPVSRPGCCSGARWPWPGPRTRSPRRRVAASPRAYLAVEQLGAGYLVFLGAQSL
ncbi:hypothetical protein [Streptomyces sp. MMG1121]|uniref:hypothetical protein n=1 Tax=Streptomyces sp. MMG1121 TaxID=1415544 RepID=UPI00131BA875|nr:hypothetical protein [Streptomyces sp. MMG1121]